MRLSLTHSLTVALAPLRYSQLQFPFMSFFVRAALFLKVGGRALCSSLLLLLLKHALCDNINIIYMYEHTITCASTKRGVLNE